MLPSTNSLSVLCIYGLSVHYIPVTKLSRSQSTVTYYPPAPFSVLFLVLTFTLFIYFSPALRASTSNLILHYFDTSQFHFTRSSLFLASTLLDNVNHLTKGILNSSVHIRPPTVPTFWRLPSLPHKEIPSHTVSPLMDNAYAVARTPLPNLLGASQNQ